MTARLPAFDKECFFITPIGDEGSDERQRADGVLEAVIEPAAEAAGLTAIRADRIGDGGQVNLQVIEHVCRAACAVADLTGGNLNVYYEVGMRHATRLPLVLVADIEERDKLPFDLLVQRTVFFSNDMKGVASCKAQVQDQLHAGLEGGIDSPIDAAVNIRQFQQGDAVERTLAGLVTSVDGLAREVSRGRSRQRIVPQAVRDAALRLSDLEKIARARGDGDLTELCEGFAIPIDYMLDQMSDTDEEVDRLRKERRRQRDRFRGEPPADARKQRRSMKAKKQTDVRKAAATKATKPAPKARPSKSS